jgi:hypothetical protein
MVGAHTPLSVPGRRLMMSSTWTKKELVAMSSSTVMPCVIAAVALAMPRARLVGARHVKPPLSTNLPPCESMTVPAPTFFDIQMLASFTMARHRFAPMAASHAPMKNIVKSSV